MPNQWWIVRVYEHDELTYKMRHDTYVGAFQDYVELCESRGALVPSRGPQDYQDRCSWPKRHTYISLRSS